jgi:predicted metalloendopeptidase
MPAAKTAMAQSRQLRQQLEEELLAAVKQAEADFHSAPAKEKEAAGERYRTALDRFNALIIAAPSPAQPEEAAGLSSQ